MVARIPPPPANAMSAFKRINGHVTPAAFPSVRQADNERSRPGAAMQPTMQTRLSACQVEISRVSVVWSQRSSEDR